MAAQSMSWASISKIRPWRVVRINRLINHRLEHMYLTMRDKEITYAIRRSTRASLKPRLQINNQTASANFSPKPWQSHPTGSPSLRQSRRVEQSLSKTCIILNLIRSLLSLACLTPHMWLRHKVLRGSRLCKICNSKRKLREVHQLHLWSQTGQSRSWCQNWVEPRTRISSNEISAMFQGAAPLASYKPCPATRLMLASDNRAEPPRTEIRWKILYQI